MKSLCAVGALALAAGCYHVTVDTGLQPSGQKITEKWVSSWLIGLVPPKTFETAAKCPDGVAKVQTQHSFLNLVAHAVTAGIYSPMQVEIECAARRSSDAGGAVLQVGTRNLQQTLTDAVLLARETGEAVFVEFEAAR